MVSLPVDSQIPGVENILKYFRQMISDLFQIAVGLRDNNIASARADVIIILSVLNNTDTSSVIKTALTPAKYTYDYQFKKVNTPEFNAEVNAKILFQIIVQSERGVRAKSFLHLLRLFYQPNSQNALEIVLHSLPMILEEEPEIFGLCLKNETDLNSLVEILRLLLGKVENVDSLQLILAIVALLLRRRFL